MGQSFILKLSIVQKPSFEVSLDPPSRGNHISQTWRYAERKLFFLVCRWIPRPNSFCVGLCQQGRPSPGRAAKQRKTETERGGRKQGMPFCFPPPNYRARVVVATGMCVCAIPLSLSPSAAGGLHTWGTPSPPISHPSRNSAELFPHPSTRRMLSSIAPVLTYSTGKHECDRHSNALTFPHV